ncbi:MAG: SurA N-terminal domain-containing protein [Gammaproteobacteria bacterium]
MLQRIHERIQGWIAWAIVLIIAVTFALWGVESFFSRQGDTSGTVVKVNGDPITEAQVQSVYDQLLSQQQETLGEDFFMLPGMEAQIRQQAVDQLIVMQLLRQDAVKNGFMISKAQAEATLGNFPEFQEDGEFSLTRFYQTVASVYATPDLFIQELQQSMLVNQLRAGMLASSFVLPNELDETIRLVEQQRSFDYLVIPAEKFIAEVKPNQEEAQRYYQDNLSTFATTEKISIEYLQLSLNDIIARQVISENDIESFYQQNISYYQKPARWKVAHILIALPSNASAEQLEEAQVKLDEIEKELSLGRDFSDLVKQYSDDIFSVSDGGELPWFTAGTLASEFEAAVESLSQPGEVTPPVRTGSGFEVIQLIDQEMAEQTPLETVREDIKEMLASDLAQSEFASMIDQLGDLTFVNVNSLQPAADALDLTIQSTDLFTRAGGEGVAEDNKVIQTSFSEDVLVAGQNSDLIQMDPQTVLVLRIKEHEPAEPRPFDAVEDQINQRLAAVDAQQQVQALGEDLLAQLRAGGDIASTLQQHDLSWQQQASITQQTQSDTDPMISTLAFQLPAHQSGTVDGEVLASGDFVIVRLIDVEEGDPQTASEEERRFLREQIENAYGLVDYEYYIQGLMAAAKLK